jgi:GNAT superfamily N-acetyltransferase
MPLSNYERLLQLAEETFAVRKDPAQLDVDEEVLEHLRRIHPATVSEEDDGNGPVAWVLLIPTTTELMEAFLSGTITEKELYERTPMGGSYGAVYLCSALVLEEYRRQGITRRLALDALERIRREHPVSALFVWSFSPEGRKSAEAIALGAGLPLFERRSAGQAAT